MKECRGKFSHVTYYSHDTNYIVGMIRDEITNELITVTGIVIDFNENQNYHFSVEKTNHEKYGEQYKIINQKNILPKSKNEIISFLSSNLFYNITEEDAENIYKVLGANCLEIIIKTPLKLDDVTMLSEIKRKTILDVLKYNNSLNELLNFLIKFKISLNTISKIYSVYKDKSIKIIKENPYELIENVDGIGFKQADKIAMMLDFDKEDPLRIKAAIVYSLSILSKQTGSTWFTPNELHKAFYNLIPNILPDEFKDYIKELIKNEKIIYNDGKIFSKKLYTAEYSTSDGLAEFWRKEKNKIKDKDIDKIIDKINSDNLEYAEKQLDALKCFLKNPYMILTGGPGTGKTTVINLLVKVYREMFKDSIVRLVAPTGRAAKRMSEATNENATTIHKFMYVHSGITFRNEIKKVDADLVICDEFSMVDIELMADFIQACTNVKKIVFVGDVNQLSSIGPGSVLKDMIASEIPTITLDKIFRQKEKSGIINLSFNIINNEYTPEIFKKFKDIHFMTAELDEIEDTIKKLFILGKENNFTEHHMQFLAPMYKGLAGIDIINKLAQEFYNPPHENKNEIELKNKTYRVGDKILQLENNRKVCNGDIGYISEIEIKGNNYFITIEFDDDILVEYTKENLKEITHGYCISIHKSQGSEFSVNVPIIHDYHEIMLQRNLIYTAVTRAKNKLIIVGGFQAFQKAVNNIKETKRNTDLQEKIVRSRMNIILDN